MSDIEEKYGPAESGVQSSIPASPSPGEAKDPRFTHKVTWYRGSIWNVFIVSLTTFLGVGMFTALQNTGAGGLQNVTTANASLALAWGPMIPVAWLASGVISKLGTRWAFFYGACGYVLYGAALYTKWAACLDTPQKADKGAKNSSKNGNQWYLMLGAFFSAVTSGVFFPLEGAIVTLYPEPWYKGRALAMWQSVYRSSNIIGGGVNMAFNYKNMKTGGLTPNTYLVFVALMAIAPFVALAVSKPEKVERTDGSKVPEFPRGSIWEEFVETLKTLMDPKVIALAILWSQPLFAPALLGTFLAKHFSVRVRALNSIILPVLEIIMFQAMGWYLDKTRSSVRRKMTMTWVVFNVLSITTMIWAVANLAIIEKHYPKRAWDWSDSGFYNMYLSVLFSTACPYVCLGFYYGLARYSFPLEQSGVRLTRVMSQLRAAEAGGAAVAYGMLAGGVSLVAAGACNLALLFLCAVSGVWLLLQIRKQDLAGEFGGDTSVAEGREHVLGRQAATAAVDH